VKPRILIVDDEAKIRALLESLLEEKGYLVSVSGDGKGALEMAASEAPDVLLLDLKMPGMDGLQVLKQLQDSGFEGKVIIMTAFGTIENAVQAMRDGAYDYVSKPFSKEELFALIERALEHRRLEVDLSLARRQLKTAFSLSGIIAADREMLKLIESVKRIAPTNAPAIISGESGTGKELFAKAIHQESPRCDRPFIAVNCSAVPGNLVESELFGYIRGAFSGADRTKPGLVAAADGGTLFLDEIAELSMEAQSKLLRFTQSGEFIPVGGVQAQRVDVRLLAATNRDLEEVVAQGKFRSDLFYRLNVVRLRVPPLRRRSEEIPLFIEHFIRKHGAELGKEAFRFDSEALTRLQAYPWPGNVRELENAVRSALIMAETTPMTAGSLPISMRDPAVFEVKPDLSVPLQEGLKRLQVDYERNAIIKALESTGGNRARAAALLSVSRNTLFKKLKHYGIS